MPMQLLVVDGADKGQSYRLPEAGSVLIGNSRKNTDICLHDLFVARVHCKVDVAEGKVIVADQVTPNGILVNGAKVAQQELRLGDVVRIGNSYLRLEEAAAVVGEPSANGTGAAAVAPDPGGVPLLSRERLGGLTGHTLGHYDIGEMVARGIVSVVFRAEDLKTEQTVALKVLSPEFPADGDELQQFIQEIKRWLPAHHPGLIAIKGVGKTGPYVWVATELIEGESAASVIKHWHATRKIKWRGVLRAALTLARALAVLHSHRLVHGNVTPAKVLIPEDGAGAKLIDLGIWDALAGSALIKSVWEEKLASDLPYMSPEHIEPNTPLDDLTDQYGLGAVLYGLLTGKPPCPGETVKDIAARVKSGMPSRPKEIQRSLPDGFQAAILRMLSKHPEERYPSPAAVIADLEAVAAECGEEG